MNTYIVAATITLYKEYRIRAEDETAAEAVAEEMIEESIEEPIGEVELVIYGGDSDD